MILFFLGQQSLIRNIWTTDFFLIVQSESGILESGAIHVMTVESFLKTKTDECGKTRGWSAHVSTPCECGQETVKWGSGVEMPVPNPANASLRPLHTPVPPSSPPVMPGIPRTLSEKSKQPGSKKNRLWRVAAMCRLSACQAHFFEKHKRGQHGLQAKLRCNQGGFTPVRSRQWVCSDNSASLHKTDYGFAFVRKQWQS